jgi:hypothetical protein
MDQYMIIESNLWNIEYNILYIMPPKITTSNHLTGFRNHLPLLQEAYTQTSYFRKCLRIVLIQKSCNILTCFIDLILS